MTRVTRLTVIELSATPTNLATDLSPTLSHTLGHTNAAATTNQTTMLRRLKTAVQKASNHGASSLQGRRPTQEDRHHADDALGFYAVYDGHGGPRAAEYAAQHMHNHMQASPAWKARDASAAITDAFEATERDFLALAEREGLSDGTTALVALVSLAESRLTVGHVGDSRGVISRGGTAVAITQDHKPELASERRRIESLGGFVSHVGCWRTMGILAMSRAIGDLFLKPYVSAEPEVRSIAIDEKDEFVVLASDGIFDVFDNEQVVRIAAVGRSPQEAAELLTESAIVAGSLDNVTAVVVALKGYEGRSGQVVAHSAAEGRREPASRSLSLSFTGGGRVSVGGGGDKGGERWSERQGAPASPPSVLSALLWDLSSDVWLESA